MPHRWKVLTVVSVAVFVASLDLFIVNIAFPDIQADFGGAGVSSLSWVLNAYAIVFAALLAAEGLSLADIVKTTVWITDYALFAPFDAAYATAFGAHTLNSTPVPDASGCAPR